MTGQHDKRCGDCSHFTPPGPTTPLRLPGFGRCDRRPVWVAMSERAFCHFNPTQWTGATHEPVKHP